jgi:hypothetical protein
MQDKRTRVCGGRIPTPSELGYNARREARREQRKPDIARGQGGLVAPPDVVGVGGVRRSAPRGPNWHGDADDRPHRDRETCHGDHRTITRGPPRHNAFPTHTEANCDGDGGADPDKDPRAPSATAGPDAGGIPDDNRLDAAGCPRDGHRDRRNHHSEPGARVTPGNAGLGS